MGCKVSSTVVVDPDKELPDYLSDTDIDLVKKSWECVTEFGMKNFGLIMFKRLMRSEKEVRSLFKKMLTVLSNGEKVIDEERLGDHAQIVMQGLGAAVESLHDSVYLTNILIVMGIRHKSYGVKPYMFQYLWESIEFALQEVLRGDLDLETHRAWQRVFSYLAGKMTEGLNTDEDRDERERKSPNDS